MLYRAPDKPDRIPEGQRSPTLESEGGRKRKKEEREEEETVAKKKGTSGSDECDKVRWCPYASTLRRQINSLIVHHRSHFG